MAEFKLVISDPKSGLSAQKQAKEQAFKAMVGLKIGDSVKGEVLGMAGYEFIITGGSDYCGFPMRRDVSGTGRKKLLAYEGVGVKRQERGMLQRKTVCGNTVHDKIAQINLKITKAGTEDLFAAALIKREESQAKRKPAAEEKEASKDVPKKPEEKPEAKPVSAEKKAEPAEEKKDAPAKQKEPAEKAAPIEKNAPAKKEAGAKETPEPAKKAVPADDKKEATPKREEPAKAPAEQRKEAEKKQTDPSEKAGAQQEPAKE
jgi:small subunit ribosomal protein S6e